MKKFLTVTCTVVVCVLLCALLLCGCDSIKNNRNLQSWRSVSTLEDLYSMQEGKCYKLANDIDLQGREWIPLFVKGFDGNGHTVSNATIITTNTDKWNDYVGLIADCTWFDNVTIDNFQLITNNRKNSNMLYCGFAVGSAKWVSNVTVTNSNCLSTVGGYVGCVAGHAVNSLTDCKSSNNTYDGNGTFGGIVGDSNNIVISNCSVTQVTASAELIGGVIGYISSNNENSIDKCSVTDCQFTASWIGGIVCIGNGSISKCNVENNLLKASKTIGGIIGANNYPKGSLSNCLSKGNTMNCTSSSGGMVGGIAGRLTVSAQSCLAINNQLSCANSNAVLAGFAVSFSSDNGAGYSFKLEGLVSFCGVYGDNMTGATKMYQFSPVSQQNMDCFVSVEDIAGVAYLPEQEWTNPTKLRETFKLDTSVWKLVEGELPSFN